jgi:hypothetical protein
MTDYEHYRIVENKFSDGHSEFFPEFFDPYFFNIDKKPVIRKPDSWVIRWVIRLFSKKEIKETQEVKNERDFKNPNNWHTASDSYHILNYIGYDTIKDAQDRIDYRKSATKKKIITNEIIHEL